MRRKMVPNITVTVLDAGRERERGRGRKILALSVDPN
jgi:hypothetical protein